MRTDRRPQQIDASCNYSSFSQEAREVALC